MVARVRRRALGAVRNRSGQALVEFVLIAPILMLLILGLVDFARAWNTFQVVTDAAREGARVAAVDNGATQDSVETVIDAALTRAGLDPSLATVTVTGANANRGQPVTTDIQYPYTFGWVGRLMSFASGSDQVQLKTSFTMRHE